jgi:hypothetical protein
MKARLTTLLPVKIGDWTVQASILDNDTICVIAWARNNLRFFVRFFTDEEKASAFVKTIVYSHKNIFHPDSDDDK